MNPDIIKEPLDQLVEMLPALWRAGWQAGVLAAMVWLLSWALGAHLPARWRYRLWLLVILRLMLPAIPPSPFSLFNYASIPAPVAVKATMPAHAVSGIASDEPIIPNRVVSPRARPAVEVSIAPVQFTWMHAIAGIWLAGAVLLLLRIFVGTFRVARAVRQLQRVTDPRLLAILTDAAMRLKIRHSPVILSGSTLTSPALFGWMRPRLLMPARVLEQFSADELRMVFLHELAHLKRRDVLVNWVGALLAVVHWFNPVVWLALWRLRVERELACDELVLMSASDNASGGRAYGQTLLRLLETFTGKAPAPVRGGVGILEGKRDLKGRIAMIARFDPMKKHRLTLPTAMTAMALLVAMALTDAVGADPQPSSKSSKPDARQVPSSETNNPADPSLANPFANAAASTTAPASADPAIAAAYSPTFSASRSAEPATKSMLEIKVPEANFAAIPFSDTIDFLRDTTSANVFVNWRALESAGIDRNTPVSIHLRDLPLGDVLDLLLSEVGGGSVALGYVVKKGVITVATDEAISNMTEVQVYDVSDLLTAPIAPTTQPTQQDKGEQLMELIRSMVEPDSWRDNGGSVGAIGLFDTRLIVTTSPKIHDGVSDFLARLRESKPVSH